jgi:hypothetical protein
MTKTLLFPLVALALLAGLEAARAEDAPPFQDPPPAYMNAPATQPPVTAFLRGAAPINLRPGAYVAPRGAAAGAQANNNPGYFSATQLYAQHPTSAQAYNQALLKQSRGASVQSILGPSPFPPGFGD